MTLFDEFPEKNAGNFEKLLKKMIKLVKMYAEINGNQSCFLKKYKLSKKKKQKYLFHRKVFQTPPKHWTTDATASWQFGILRKDPSTKSRTHETETKFRIFILIFIQLIPKKKTELYGNHLFRVTSY